MLQKQVEHYYKAPNLSLFNSLNIEWPERLIGEYTLCGKPLQ